MFALKDNTETLELLTSSAAGIDYSITYNDFSATGSTKGTSEGKITSATTTPILTAPAVGSIRVIEQVSFRNIHASTANSLTVKKDISATEYYITCTVPMAAGETLQYENGSGWRRFDALGQTMGTGATGTAGSVIRNGSGVPSNGLGVDGDYYIDTATGDLYNKVAGAYVFLFTLTGGGGSTLTQVVVSVDANIVAAPNTRLVIPNAVLTAGKTIDMTALSTDGDVIEIYNLEETNPPSFLAGTVIYTYGSQTIDIADPLRVTTYKIAVVDGDLRQ